MCSHHSHKYGIYYSSRYKYCCNPFELHKKNSNFQLSILKLELCEKFDSLNSVKLIPGKKICKNCLGKIVTNIKEYENLNDSCCNPFKKHRDPVKSNLFVIDKIPLKNFEIYENKKVCQSCFNKIQDTLNSENVASDEEMNVDVQVESQCSDTPDECLSLFSNTPEQSTSSQSSHGFTTNSQEIGKLEKIFENIGVPPLKRRKFNYEKFIKEVTSSIQVIVNKITSQISKCHGVQMPNFYNLAEIEADAKSFNCFIEDLQSKYKQEKKYSEKISLLTLIPNDWTFKKTARYFDCSWYMYNEACKLKKSQAILAKRISKEYLKIPKNVRTSIVNFYYDDSISRMCSGTKECLMQKVPGSESIALQKRILLFDLKDLYNIWKEKNQNNFDVLCSFSLFASLRPKECVIAGSPGTHTICVCQIHQNFKLKLNALQRGIDYRSIIHKCVCSVDNRDCMNHNCNNCPTKINIREILYSLNDTSEDEKITYNNWLSVTIADKAHISSLYNQTKLESLSEPYNEFIDNLVEDLWILTKHHYISENQKRYFNHCKDNLDKDTAIILMDFAEKYSFICQDSTQGFYYNNTSDTVHPAVIYCRNQVTNNLDVKSLCIISNCSKQTAYTVNTFQEIVLSKLKQDCPWIVKVIYFTDGAPTQYKNKNHFINLCFHEDDFGIAVVEHNFFATSHGKNACDGIGATTKRKTRKFSLQQLVENQIVTPEKMYEYCNEKILGIEYFFVDEKDVIQKERKLRDRFGAAKTIKNTRDHHCFSPVDKTSLRIKKDSFDEESYIVKIT